MNNEQRILITGGSGYLGRHLVPLAAQTVANAYEVGYTFYQNDPLGLPSGRRLDLRDETAVSHCIAQFQPHAIIHTAGSNRA
ncbi:MAG: NAD-dependent epimerase/dehydratase family protein, partial [Chloroflexi bacterium]|nr:NAD-dependent epimerase/dehydratase family protein [Chloroflexota bacterium]